jgi:hypothetical protein
MGNQNEDTPTMTEMNPLAGSIMQDAAQLGAGLKGAKEGVEGVGAYKGFSNEAKDVKGSHEFLDPLDEQAAFDSKYGKHLPVLYEAGKEGEEAFGGPSGDSGRTFTERHQEMVAKGEEVLAQAKEQGLTPKDIHEEFWNNVYPKLPEEVQARFEALAKRPGVKVTNDFDDLERMSRWYVALMQEANNYPWNPKVQGYLENKIDAKQVDDLPDSYTDRNFTNSIMNGGDWSTNSFKPGDSLTNYVRAVKQNAEGGSFNTVLEAIANNSSDPFERVLSRLLISEHSDPIYQVVNKEGNKALANINNAQAFGDDARSTIKSFINSDKGDLEGISPASLLHEGAHHALLAAYELGRDSKTRGKYPVYAKFHDDMSDMIVKIMQSLPEAARQNWQYAFTGGNIEGRGSLGHEFMSMILTDRDFMAVIDGLKMNKAGEITRIHGYRPVGDAIRDAMAEVLVAHNVPANVKGRIISEFKGFLRPTDERSAFKEVIKMLMPILQYTKKNPYDTNDTAGILSNESENGWIPSKMRQEMFGGDEGTAVDFNVTDGSSNTSNAPLSKKTIGKLSMMVSPYKNWQELRDVETYIDPFGKKYPDLNRITGSFYPVSSVPKIANNPIPTFAVTQIRQILGDVHVLEKTLLKAVDEFVKAPQEVQNRVVGMLAQVNRPEYQDILKQKRQQKYGDSWKTNPEALRIDESDVPTTVSLQNGDFSMYKETLEPLFEAMYNIDKIVLSKYFGREFISDIIGYFPRYYGFGRFSVTAFGKDGEMVFYKRAATFKEIRDHEQWAKSKGLITVRDVGNDYTMLKGHLMALIEIDPNSAVGRMASGSISAAELHRRTQEFERKAFNVAGFLGQNMNNPKEVQQLNSSIFHRIRQTSELMKAGRLLGDVWRPIQKDPWTTNYPNAVKWVGDVVRREVGADISELGWLDRSLEALFNHAHNKWLTVTAPKYMKDVRPSEITVSPGAAKKTVRDITALSSAYILTGNIGNMVTNAFSVPLVSLLGGLPDSFLLKSNPNGVYYAMRAHTQSMADWIALGLGVLDLRVKEVYQKAKDRGLIETGMFNDLPQLSNDMDISAAEKAFRTAVTIPRKIFNDPIELATNIQAFLYYNRLVEKLFPQLSQEMKFKHTEDLMKRYTGDYRAFNKQLMFSKGGVLGTPFSNFSIWAGHRIAQSYETFKDVGVRQKIAPLVTMMGAAIITAGIEGAPLAQDYENLRQFGIKHDLYDWPPLDLALKKINSPFWVRKGAVLVNNPWNMDFSSRGKWSGYTDMSGVTLTIPGKQIDIWQYLWKENMPDSGESLIGDKKHSVGASIDDTGQFVQALPPAFQGPARQALMTRDFRGDGRKTFLSRKGEAIYDQKPEEKIPNLLNFRTNRQSEQADNKYNLLYEEKMFEKQTKDLKKVAIENMLQAINERKMGNPKRAAELESRARTNLLNLKKVSPTGFETFANDLVQAIGKESDTTEEKMLKEVLKSKDAGRIMMILNTLKVMDHNRASP